MTGWLELTEERWEAMVLKRRQMTSMVDIYQ